jgi:hypothetical protein
MRIINPDDCSLAVLKGAVLFGHDPKAITSRISKFTYGIVINQIFKEGFHPENKRQRYRGVDICDDIFDIHLRKVNSGTGYHPMKSNFAFIIFPVLCSLAATSNSVPQ